jgi:hypothetical protein
MAFITHFSYKSSDLEEYPAELVKIMEYNFSKTIVEEFILQDKSQEFIDSMNRIGYKSYERKDLDKTYCIIYEEVESPEFTKFVINDCLELQCGIDTMIERLKGLLFNTKIETRNHNSNKFLLKLFMRIRSRQDKVYQDLEEYKKILIDDLDSLEEDMNSGNKSLYSTGTVSNGLGEFKVGGNEGAYLDMAGCMKRQIEKIEDTLKKFKLTNFWSIDLDNDEQDLTPAILEALNTKIKIETYKKVFNK